MYVAFLPRSAVRQFGGSVDGTLRGLQNGLNRPGTYVLVAGRTFRAGSTDTPEGATPKAANEALEAHPGDIDAILLDFADRMGDVRSGKDSGGVPAFIPLAFLVLVIGGIGLLITTRVRKQRRVEAEQLAEVRGSVREDVVELGDEIRALDLDISMPGASEEAQEHYETALGAYERASSAVDRVQSPRDLEPVGAAVEEGRYAMACARARLEGRELPERTRALLLRPAPRPVGPRGRVVAALRPAAQRARLRGRRPARRARGGPRGARDHARRAPDALLGRRPRVRAVHGRLLRRRAAARAVPRLAAERRDVDRRRLQRLRLRLVRAWAISAAAATSAAGAAEISAAAATSAAATSS